MDIDLGALRSLEAEKDISMELAIKAIEDALLVAYHRTDGTPPRARVEIDRGSGHVTVWAAETGDGFGARLESFLTDPQEEPDPAKWETQVAIRLADDQPRS